jgi:hypothetical protein
LPRELVFRLGDSPLVRNLDNSPHRIGPLWIAPGGQERTAVGWAFFATEGLACTVHPAGALSVVPRARPNVAVTIPVALLAGLPMAFAAVVASAIVSRLDDGRGGPPSRRGGEV